MFLIKGVDFEKKVARIKFSLVNWNKNESTEIKNYTSTQLMLNTSCDLESEGILTKDFNIINYSIENSNSWIQDNKVILKVVLSEKEFIKLI